MEWWLRDSRQRSRLDLRAECQFSKVPIFQVLNMSMNVSLDFL